MPRFDKTFGGAGFVDVPPPEVPEHPAVLAQARSERELAVEDAEWLLRAASKIRGMLTQGNDAVAAATARAWAAYALGVARRVEGIGMFREGFHAALTRPEAVVEVHSTASRKDRKGHPIERPPRTQVLATPLPPPRLRVIEGGVPAHRGPQALRYDCGEGYGLLTVAEMADRIGVSEATIRNRLRQVGPRNAVMLPKQAGGWMRGRPRA